MRYQHRSQQTRAYHEEREVWPHGFASPSSSAVQTGCSGRQSARKRDQGGARLCFLQRKRPLPYCAALHKLNYARNVFRETANKANLNETYGTYEETYSTSRPRSTNVTVYKVLVTCWCTGRKGAPPETLGATAAPTMTDKSARNMIGILNPQTMRGYTYLTISVRAWHLDSLAINHEQEPTIATGRAHLTIASTITANT